MADTMTIKPIAFANTLAITSVVLVLFLTALRTATPGLFVFIFNAQFFGADVASLLPVQMDLLKMVGELFALVGGAWGFGYVGAVVYNRLVEETS